MDDISIDKLQLIRNIIITAVVPSVLRIIRLPLRELIKRLIKIFGGEMRLERFENFQYIGIGKGSIKGLIYKYVRFLVYKNKNWYYRYIVVDDEEDKTLHKSKVFKTPYSCKRDIINRYTLYVWWFFDEDI